MRPLKAIQSQSEIDAFPPFTFPNYSDEKLPEDWEQVDTLFCDYSGVGRPGEPALTIKELKAELEVGKAYAIIDQGQFQLQLGVFQHRAINETFTERDVTHARQDASLLEAERHWLQHPE